MLCKGMISIVLPAVALVASCSTSTPVPPQAHPQSDHWQELFAPDLSNAIFPEGVWTVKDGVLTASRDHNIWTVKEYDCYVLDLEFKNDFETNSGVVVHCHNIENWIPSSVEIQIADDYSDKWGKADPTWQCGAVFGHLPASERTVKEPGQWNRCTITCIDQMIYVLLNGKQVIEMDMALWTSAKTNPDGSSIPGWLSTPLAELPTKGRIGLQGKHGSSPIYFRNIRIEEIE